MRHSRAKFRCRIGAALALCAVLLVGCFESDEERAVAAYRDDEYAIARTLAHKLADADNPRGFELLALMTAQGLGGEMDFAAAFALAERAIALDASYEPSRATIESFIDATATSAEAAFAAGHYDRARALAEPLEAFGHAGGGALVNRLITGGYVALYLAFQHMRSLEAIAEIPLKDSVAAISCGLWEGDAVLDLDYAEDSTAQADANFVFTGAGGIVEVQGTAEGDPFSQDQFLDLMALARKGVGELGSLQKTALGL